MGGTLLKIAVVVSFSFLAFVSSGSGSPPKRSQEPAQPLPYREEKVYIQNPSSSVRLAGTLSLPMGSGTFPAVLLISGSGPQNRDEEILGHRPFLILADFLVRQGLVVLRLDDRGVAESTGNHATALNRDFAEDAYAGVQWLKSRKEVKPGLVGLIGHSAGGVIAPMVAQKTDTAFLVLLASPGLRGVEFVTQRDRFLLEFTGVTISSARAKATAQRWKEINEILMSDATVEQATERIRPILDLELQELTRQEAELFQGLGMELKPEAILREMKTPWYRDNLKYDPRPVLRMIKCPVLALYGDKDVFVPAAANSRATESALRLGGNQNFTVQTLPFKNHFFQTCKTGMPIEVYELEETMSPAVLKRIGDWIRKVSAQPTAAK